MTAAPGVTLQLPKLYYSLHTATDNWEKRNWIELETAIKYSGVDGNAHNYSATIPTGIAKQNVDWYVLVSDTRGQGQWATTVSTIIYNTVTGTTTSSH